METADLDLAQGAAPNATSIETTLKLTEPRSRLRVRLPAGEAGRAEAMFEKRSWAAKHYWQEQSGVTVYEFDAPLPEGEIKLRIPFAPSGPLRR